MYYRLPNIIAINIADKIQSLHCHHHVRSVPDVFSGEILLVFPVVHFQTSYRKTLGMIFIMKEILILLRQNHACLLKVGEMKTKRNRWSNQQTRIFKNRWKEYQNFQNLAGSTLRSNKRIFRYSMCNIQISNIFLWLSDTLNIKSTKPTFDSFFYFFFWAECDTQLSRIFDYIKYYL